MFTTEDVGEMPIPELLFSGSTDNALLKIKTSKEKELEQTDKLKSKKSPGPSGFKPRVLKEFKKKLAEQLAKI